MGCSWSRSLSHSPTPWFLFMPICHRIAQTQATGSVPKLLVSFSLERHLHRCQRQLSSDPAPLSMSSMCPCIYSPTLPLHIPARVQSAPNINTLSRLWDHYQAGGGLSPQMQLIRLHYSSPPTPQGPDLCWGLSTSTPTHMNVGPEGLL